VVSRVRSVLQEAVPAGAIVLVASKGDDELTRIDGRTAWHFPRTEDGVYSGYHPADAESAIASLEAERGRGADFLLVPPPTLWWLDFYAELRAHLEGRYTLAVRDQRAGALFDLRVRADRSAAHES